MEAFDIYERKDSDRSEDEWGYESNNDQYQQELRDGFADIERSSRADDCGGLPVPIDKIKNVTQDPEERFKIYVGAISHSITENEFYDISVEDRNKMCRMASQLNNVKYLNPTAYILGYISTNGGQEINKKTLQNIFTFLPMLTDDSVKPPDVIRYARFWLNLDTENI